jgi:hypothetical protein
MAHSRNLRGILDAAERRIDGGAGIPHDEFWKQMELSKGSRQSNGHKNKRQMTPRKKKP